MAGFLCLINFVTLDVGMALRKWKRPLSRHPRAASAGLIDKI
jgi:hypothetical protein